MVLKRLYMHILVTPMCPSKLVQLPESKKEKCELYAVLLPMTSLQHKRLLATPLAENSPLARLAFVCRSLESGAPEPQLCCSARFPACI